MNSKFEIVIQSCIVLNVIFMALVSFPVDPTLKTFLDSANLVFVVIFAIEMTSKMIGLRINYYFADSWNRFDCVVTLLSILALVPNLYFGNASVFRTFRIARLLRLVKIYKGFQSIINTLILCGPSLLNVGALLMLLWFVYAVAGMYLFGLYDDFADAQVLTDQINFGTFYNSFSMVFQCITGEN